MRTVWLGSKKRTFRMPNSSSNQLTMLLRRLLQTKVRVATEYCCWVNNRIPKLESMIVSRSGRRAVEWEQWQAIVAGRNRPHRGQGEWAPASQTKCRVANMEPIANTFDCSRQAFDGWSDPAWTHENILFVCHQAGYQKLVRIRYYSGLFWLNVFMTLNHWNGIPFMAMFECGFVGNAHHLNLTS